MIWINFREMIIDSWHRMNDLLDRPNEKQKRKLIHQRSIAKENRAVGDEMRKASKLANDQANTQRREEIIKIRHENYIQSTTACPSCKIGRMSIKKVHPYQMAGLLFFIFGIVVFFVFGCAIVGLIFGPILCIVGICLDQRRKNVWKCDSCGLQADVLIDPHN